MVSGAGLSPRNRKRGSRRRREAGVQAGIILAVAGGTINLLRSRMFIVQGEIEGGSGMSEGADADPIDTGFRDRAQGVEGDSAGGFEQDAGRGLVAALDGLA